MEILKFNSKIVFVVVALIGWLSSTTEANERPVIDSPKTVIKKPGETLVLKCSGASPVAWDLPTTYEADERVDVKNELKSSSSPQYETILELKNLTYMDRETFVCYFPNDVKYEETVNVFIDDPENLLHLPSSPPTTVKVVHVRKGKANVIPYCKPTHPDVAVTLSVYGTNVLEQPSWKYSIENGFVVDPAVTETQQQYTCSATRGSKTEELTIYVLVVVVDSPTVPPHPTINSTLAKGIPVGGTFEFDCQVASDSQAYFVMNWTQPEEVLNSGRATFHVTDLSTLHTKKFSSRLVVVNATKEDGLHRYFCNVLLNGLSYSANDTASIFARGEEYLEVNSSEDGNITANASKQQDAIWIIGVFGFPKARTFSWTNSKDKELITNGKSRYTIVHNVDRNQVELTINRAVMTDSGSYKFTADNGYMSKTLDLFLTVTDGPHVTLKTNRTFFRLHRPYEFTCSVTGYPYPDIRWYFQQCDPDDLERTRCPPPRQLKSTHPTSNVVYMDAPRTSLQKLFFNVPGNGFLLCAGNNSLGSHSEYIPLTAVDFPENGELGFGIHGVKGEAEKQPIETEDAISICSASKVGFSGEIRWYYKDDEGGPEIPAEQLKGVTISEKTTPWSYQKQLKIENIVSSFNGTYRCEVETLSRSPPILSDSIALAVRKMVAPVINNTNLNQTKIKTGSTWNIGKLYCEATGVPEPVISWYKDDEPIESIPKLKDEVIIQNNFIDFKGLTSEYNGRYTCRASNRIGADERYVDVEVQKEANWGMVISLISLAVVLGVVSVIAFIQYRRDQKMKRWIKKLKLKDFENGDVEKINPNEGVQAQVNLLPYDKKYEFPRERLKLGIRIGSGAFGQVVRAEAMGIIAGEPKTTVAVKMVKPNSDESHFKALMSELKIMIHLGQNLNVVNLLGACTKELVKKRELFVIVEYCKYGSLLSYLHRHRIDFVDQLDRNLDIVDPDICYPIEQVQSPGERLNYAALTFTDSGPRVTANGYHTMREIQMEHPELSDGYLRTQESHPSKNKPNSDDYALSTHVRSVCTDMSYLSNSPTTAGTDGRKRNSSTSTTWTNGHYRGVYPYREVRPITTTDLLCWSFQIANGMDYLVSRNVLHGDLAARNVLLAEKNVVKICDFGLARELYEEKYRKKTEVPLPIKWMALESIYYRVFSTQSDVWSFGVVMWELFTLGKNPYPGMEPDEHFYTSLSQGYRMEKPSYAPSSMYDLMCACWDKEPSNRPSFTTISDRIGDLMQEGLRNHYVDLNVPYLHHNQERMEGREDFLERMRGPDFSSVSKRATPACSYANLTVDVPPNSDYLVPRPVQHGPNTLYVPLQAVDNYQNLNGSDVEPSRLQCLANNAGYVYMNKDSLGPEDVFSPRPAPQVVQDNGSPRFNFPEQSPQHNGSAVSSEKRNNDNAISNMNYVPNNIFLPEPNVTEDRSPRTSPTNHEARDDKVSTSPRSRHKNDSGVSSIDSNFETNLKRTPPPHPNGNMMWNGGDIIDISDTQNHNTKQFQSQQSPYIPQSDMACVTE